jgi:hypothetical protein
MKGYSHLIQAAQTPAWLLLHSVTIIGWKNKIPVKAAVYLTLFSFSGK